MSVQEIRKHAYVRIVEEPASKALRFRYECEGRSAGSIPGVNSTPDQKTFPSIQVVGYTGRAVVVVSCVTKDRPYRPHPYNLVGRNGCKKGVCTLQISPETMSVTFSHLGIQCVKKKDIGVSLTAREEVRVDPFKTGFSHRNEPNSIDLKAVRLCFQVFLQDERGKFSVPLRPVVSQPIYDKVKAISDLAIVQISNCVSCVDGGTTELLLCEKVDRGDIQIRFFEEKDGQIIWEDFGDFNPSYVHKQTGIWFRTPKYRTLDIKEPVKVFIQLRRPSDGAESEPLPFEYLPLLSDPCVLKRKRLSEIPGDIMRIFREHEKYDEVDIKADTLIQESPKMSVVGAPMTYQHCVYIQEVRKIPYVRILEEPASNGYRFRYECEGKSAGSIPGANSTLVNKTFPSIQIVGYTGRAVVVVSCVTKDYPYRPHPFNLVGRQGCKRGVCTLPIPPQTTTITFQKLGIQCVKKRDIEAALKIREEIRVDPYKTGFNHGNQLTPIDLYAVRLCFQVFLESEKEKFTIGLDPVVSQPIYDKKAMPDLVIAGLSDCVSYVDGGRKNVILLCERVDKHDIQIRFFETNNGQVVWEGFGEFHPSQVHNQTAIWFRPPSYHTLDVATPVRVSIQLKRPSDGATSEPLPFEFLPLELGPELRIPKRKKIDDEVVKELEEFVKLRNVLPPSDDQMSEDGAHYAPKLSNVPEYQYNTPRLVQCNDLSGNIQGVTPTVVPPCISNGNGNLDSAIPVGCLLDLDEGEIKPTNLNCNVLLPNVPHKHGNTVSGNAADESNWTPPPKVYLENSDADSINSLLNLDSDELIKQVRLNSSEFASLLDNLSDSFSATLSLCENGRT